MRRHLAPTAALIACALLAPIAHAQLFDGGFGINASHNIWVAGRTAVDLPAAGGGLYPNWIDLPSGAGRVITLDIAGTVSYGAAIPSNGPDGITAPVCTIPPFNSLSGMTTGSIRCVTGVMLGDAAPAGTAPPSLNFPDANFATLAPVLQQTFFIGDGRQGLGAPAAPQHVFTIPDTATRLFLGFMDSDNCGGPPAAYGDNSGGSTVHYSVSFACIGVESQSSFYGDCIYHGAQCTIRLRGPGVPHYQWQRETAPDTWADLTDGATPAGSIVSGANQPTLGLTPVTPSDYGRYRCFITTPCGNVTSQPTPLHLECNSRADIGAAGSTPGCDTILGNNDFIVFITYFFEHNPIADFGRQGGVAPGDGVFDNNDFIVFIDEFFAGC